MARSVIEFVNTLSTSKKANLLRRGLARHARLMHQCVKEEVKDAGHALQLTHALLSAQHVDLTALDLKDDEAPTEA